MHTNLHTALIVFLMVSLAFASYAPPAHAIPVGVIATLQLIFDIGSWVASISNDIANVASEVLAVYADFKANILDPVAWAIAKSQIHDEANTILTQVRGGGNARGETGGPLFVTDWTKVSNTAVSNQRRFFLQELEVSKKIDPAFQGTFLTAFSANPNSSAFNRLQSSFGRDTGCDDANNAGGQSCLQNFLGDFSQGDWVGWNSVVTRPGNNPYHSYIELQAEKQRREETARQARVNEALASGGALGTQDCVDESSPEFVGPPAPAEEQNQSSATEPNQTLAPDQAPTIKKCKVTRPGSTVSSDLSKVLGGPTDTLQQADSFDEILVGAFASLISSLRSQGIASDNESDNFVETSRTALKETNIAQAEKTINELKDSVNKSINDLASIWEIKAKSFDLIDEISPGLIYEINQTQSDVDAGGACADKPQVYEQLPSALENAKNEKDSLANEVGYPVNLSDSNMQNENGVPPLGYYENGGLYSEKLFNQQADLEYLSQVIKNPDVEPQIVASSDVTAIYKNQRLSSSERLNMAQQLIGSEVGKVERLLAQVGDPNSAKAEQQGINQKVLAQRQNRRSCSFPDK